MSFRLHDWTSASVRKESIRTRGAPLWGYETRAEAAPPAQPDDEALVDALRARSPYVGRFGQIDVFHFDPVSTSLSKLNRGHEADLAAVRSLSAAGMVTADDLQAAWQEIAPRLPERGLSSTEIAEFEDNLRLVLG